MGYLVTLNKYFVLEQGVLSSVSLRWSQNRTGGLNGGISLISYRLNFGSPHAIYIARTSNERLIILTDIFIFLILHYNNCLSKLFFSSLDMSNDRIYRLYRVDIKSF